jgi:hypothetical protein
MKGLGQELKIIPNVHYKPIAHNSSRVLSLRLVGLNPHYLGRVKSLQSQLTLWAGLPDKYSIRVGHDSYAVIVEIPKPKSYWQQVTIEQLEQRHYIRRGPIACLGLGLQDEPKRIDFSQEAMGHVFIVGETRSGKTNSQKLVGWNIARNTSPNEAKMIIFDVVKKGFKWADFSNVHNLLHPLVTDIETSDRVLSWLNLEIEKRAINRYITPKIFILIDELKALTDDSKVATEYLSRIASIGAEFGLHLILSTQYPQIKMLGSSELKRNISTRLCGRVDDSQAAVNALGIADSGAESLQGYGDFLLKDFNGLSRLTIAHIQPKHIEQLERAETEPLSLPESDIVNSGAKREPDLLEPDQVALALFEPMGINRLANRLSIGSTKATRVKLFADDIRQWAIENGHKCIGA